MARSPCLASTLITLPAFPLTACEAKAFAHPIEIYPMSHEFATKQEEVVAAYDRFVHGNDPRDQVAYMASKFQVDYRLMGLIDIKGKRIVNIGCAFPVDELYFASKVGEWVGVDLSPETIKLAQDVTKNELHPTLAEKMKYFLQDATRLELSDNSFDLGLSFSTFDHIPSHEMRQQAINELARVTKPGGHVIVTTPNRRHLAYYARSHYQQAKGLSHYGYEYCFAPEELKAMLLAAGLKPLRFVSTFSYRDLDLALSPDWQRLFLRFGIGVANTLSYFGHRMGYLAQK